MAKKLTHRKQVNEAIAVQTATVPATVEKPFSISLSRVENYIYTLLYGKVSNNVYIGSLPATLNTDEEDMVLIDCGLKIDDRDAYAKGPINIFLYVKPLERGRKNIKRMLEMEDALQDIIRNQSDDNYMLNILYTSADYDSTYSMHFNIYALNLIIK